MLLKIKHSFRLSAYPADLLPALCGAVGLEPTTAPPLPLNAILLQSAKYSHYKLFAYTTIC